MNGPRFSHQDAESLDSILANSPRRPYLRVAELLDITFLGFLNDDDVRAESNEPVLLFVECHREWR
jgi:hypothetical protein